MTSHPAEATPHPQVTQESLVIWGADREVSRPQRTNEAAYTPPAYPQSAGGNRLCGHGQSGKGRITTETITFADWMVRHLVSCPWLHSNGDPWHDMKACERWSVLDKARNEALVDPARAQHPIARAQVVGTTSETTAETTSKNTSESISKTTSMTTLKTTSEVGTSAIPRPSVGILRAATGQFGAIAKAGKSAQRSLKNSTKIAQARKHLDYPPSHNTATQPSQTVSTAAP